ncbi:hypothetical protein MKEN_00144800 [Mycena kentingensis (nom. inval.)]|nr:hypothetical protein MKEN_00144800 [Mycena kentingensis (nom. inval.)]
MDLLLSLLALAAIMGIRVVYKDCFRRGSDVPTLLPREAAADVEDGGSATNTESSPLLSSSASSSGQQLAMRRNTRLGISALALGYMLVNGFALKMSVEYYAASPLLCDARFMFGRGGMFAAALYTIAHSLSTAPLGPDQQRRQLQADGITLLAFPFLFRLILAPGFGYDAAGTGVLDLVVAPILGAASILLSVVA